MHLIQWTTSSKLFFARQKNPVLGIYCFPVQRLTLYAQSSEQNILLLALLRPKLDIFQIMSSRPESNSMKNTSLPNLLEPMIKIYCYEGQLNVLF